MRTITRAKPDSRRERALVGIRALVKRLDLGKFLMTYSGTISGHGAGHRVDLDDCVIGRQSGCGGITAIDDADVVLGGVRIFHDAAIGSNPNGAITSGAVAAKGGRPGDGGHLLTKGDKLDDREIPSGRIISLVSGAAVVVPSGDAVRFQSWIRADPGCCRLVARTGSRSPGSSYRHGRPGSGNRRPARRHG